MIGASNTVRIKNIEDAVIDIKKDYKELCKKIDDLNVLTHSSINKILGSIVVACVLLVINMFVGG